jgi:hypothetical protein
VKLPEELEAYRHAMKVAHMVIREAFSNKVITPGKTTTQDVVWWMRQRVANWASARGSSPRSPSGAGRANHPGRHPARRHAPHRLRHRLHGLSTDTQHNAYVLRPGETDAPQGLKDGLKAANRLQDLTMQYARLERTGNEALADALGHAKKEGLVPSIYCHAIGYHGHAAGPPIGMTDYQDGVPVRGDYVFRPNTWHSIELNATHPVPEWDNQAVRFALEEDAAHHARRQVGLDGRPADGVLSDQSKALGDGQSASVRPGQNGLITSRNRTCASAWAAALSTAGWSCANAANGARLSIPATRAGAIGRNRMETIETGRVMQHRLSPVSSRQRRAVCGESSQVRPAPQAAASRARISFTTVSTLAS